MRTKYLFPLLASFGPCLSAGPHSGELSVGDLHREFGGQQILETKLTDPIPGSLEAELERLQSLGRDFNWDIPGDTPLPRVIRAIADAADMSYFNIPESLAADMKVSMTLHGNPYEVLDQMAEIYGFEMQYQDGIWRFGFPDPTIQYAKVYPLNHYSYDRIEGTYGSQTIDLTSAGASGRSNPLTTTITDLLRDSNSDVLRRPGSTAEDAPAPFVVQHPAPLGDVPDPKVTLDADTRQLFVQATRAQHRLLAAYLDAVDRPLDLVEVEIKFLEVEVDPHRAFGLDWSGSLQDGYGAQVSNFESTPGEWSFPNTILSSDDLQAKLRAFAQDDETRMVEYPRTVTLSNREVVFDAVDRVPYIADAIQKTDETYSELSRKEFLEAGTRIRVDPIVQNDGSILLDLQIEVSDLTNFVELAGDPVPQTSTRRFRQSVVLDDNYTLALGGLERSVNKSVEGKIPLLGDIPFFGFAFKHLTEQEYRSNLLMLVTVRRVDAKGGGLAETPRHIVRSKGLASSDRRVFDGRADETLEELQSSLAGLSADVDIVVQSFIEGRDRVADHRRVRVLTNEGQLMNLRLQEMELLQEVDADTCRGLRRQVAHELQRLANLEI